MNPPDAAPRDRAGRVHSIHASAVSIGGRGLLITGSSCSGKSRLALALIAASYPARPIVLIGDDRILLSARAGDPSTRVGDLWTRAGDLVARPHPRIAGFIERRGLGIVAVPHADAAPVAGVVELGPPSCDAAFLREAGGLDLPRLAIARVDDAGEAATRVLRWWGGRSATQKA